MQAIAKKLQAQWQIARPHIEIADTLFTILRLIVLAGGIAWLVFSDIPQNTFRDVSRILIFFYIYTPFIYLWLFTVPHKKRLIYIFSLFFDLAFISLMIRATGGFESPFFDGFYLLTALYSFYYGPRTGIAVASITALIYLIIGNLGAGLISWTDLTVRLSMLFLIALPLGMLSKKLNDDRDEIEKLNLDLNSYIEDLRYVQGKLIEAEKLSALGRLTADVAHEIRNPLTSLGGFVRRLDKRLQPGTKEKEYAEIACSEVERLERILRDVLTFSREAKTHMEYQDINETLSDFFHSYAEVFNERGIQLKKNLASLLPRTLIDRDQVRQVLNNLVSNALDAMPLSGALTVNTLMTELHNINYVVIEIADTGTGIPPEKVNMIFEPFYSTKQVGVGTGLGLSICRKIIEEHNGLIRVESAVGKGTSFKLFFPCQEKAEGAVTNCWEYMKCGVETSEVKKRCPAYPNYGRICWAVAGTFCEKKIEGRYAQKLGDCKKCKFYQAVAVSRQS